MHRPTAPVALLAFTLLAVAACGSGVRPSVDDVADAIRDGRISSIEAENADCSARVFVESDLSDTALLKLVDRADRPVTTQDDRDALVAVEERLIAECDLQQAAG